MSNTRLQDFIDVLDDNPAQLKIAQVKGLDLYQDKSQLNLLLHLLPEEWPVTATMTWNRVAPNAGDFEFPSVDDLCLVGFVDRDVRQAYVIGWLTSVEDFIPLQAAAGHRVIKAKSGKKLYIGSDTKINIVSGDQDGTENLVLGKELKTLLVNILTQLSTLSNIVATHTHIGNLGAPTTTAVQASQATAVKSELDALKVSPVEDEKILSAIAFTEKGGL